MAHLEGAQRAIMTRVEENLPERSAIMNINDYERRRL